LATEYVVFPLRGDSFHNCSVANDALFLAE
jgi:hypothetical protein